MKLRDFIGLSKFESYSLQANDNYKTRIVTKDYAIEHFGNKDVTEIDYTIIFTNKSEGVPYENNIIPRLVLK